MNYQRLKTKDQKPFAKKSFGQNFLVDENYIKQIIAELDPQVGETIVEVGAGRGALTRKLVDLGANVLAIELDRDLIPILQREFADRENFRILHADALKIDFHEILPAVQNQRVTVKLVANLPYNISTAILQRLIEHRECFSELVLMLQREVVERITALPGRSERGYLSVLIEAYAKSEKLFDVPPQAFRPLPQVWSAVVKLSISKSDLLTDSVESEKLFWQMIGLCFAQKRKTIFNNLKNAPIDLIEKLIGNESALKILAKSGIEPSRRAETLTLAEWILLFESSQPSEKSIQN